MPFKKSIRGAGAYKPLTNVKILLVEDSRTYQEMIAAQLDASLGAQVVVCANYQDVLDAVCDGENQFDIALTDLNVPGADHGEVMDELLSRNIPTVVFTGTFSEKVRDRMLSKNVVDYVVKDSPDSVRILVETARKALLNCYSRVLIVDDQKTTQQVMVSLLQAQLYQVHAVFGGKEALHLLKNGEEFDLIVTDYNMPGMNGDEFVSNVRKGGFGDNMRILGVSSTGNSLMSAQFLKAGANDFMQRPFAAEEFQWRVGENVETVRLMHKLNNMAYTDYLTSVFNRRFLFSDGEEIVQEAHSAGHRPSVIMFDLDNFKQFNEKYGYEAGDHVLRYVAHITSSVADDGHNIITRLGGEEFGIVLPYAGLQAATEMAEKLKSQIAKTDIPLAGRKVKVTASFGVAEFAPNESIDSVLNVADVYLHDAKHQGRNRVIAQQEGEVRKTA